MQLLKDCGVLDLVVACEQECLRDDFGGLGVVVGERQDVPVVSLWIPFQLMGDIWRAGLPDGQRRKAAWLPALWWASFLLSGVHRGYSRDRYYPWPHLSDGTLTVSLCLLAVSGMALIVIVRIVSYGPAGSPHPCLVAALPASLPQ